MGFKDDVRAEGAALREGITLLDERVSALESLAAQLRRSGGAVPQDVRRTEGVSASTLNRVDYGAVAFGLSEIKRKVSQLSNASRVASEYAGVVQYFADVFAKADPEFDAATFKRQAGV